MSYITVEITILKPLDLIWECFTDRDHIEEWYFASQDWHCPNAENNFEVGGTFNYRMEAKDEDFGFNFTGVFDEITTNDVIKYHLDDGRKVDVKFKNETENSVKLIQNFEAEKENPHNLQKKGWFAILNNFKNYVENYEEQIIE
ncbi:SRPBCC domain-containing protein [Frigoriflavimonas asaccharolytica]|uniref:Uncharacterized protein YndB with AHSA1/START domain n=1 Tax=Frigoriflavimonas asaccharolytica TaxID=2735899 RepID=A0A8J8GB03_9FLAO|nr:SRPBCC domain-containing protein [Frigoriflavimonas asaccharolytica]NRS93222.1 uncharacterized protein YndB with AHSA1/START domain [Frigoriflavimonas asaccharolytica]